MLNVILTMSFITYLTPFRWNAVVEDGENLGKARRARGSHLASLVMELRSPPRAGNNMTKLVFSPSGGQLLSVASASIVSAWDLGGMTEAEKAADDSTRFEQARLEEEEAEGGKKSGGSEGEDSSAGMGSMGMGNDDGSLRSEEEKGGGEKKSADGAGGAGSAGGEKKAGVRVLGKHACHIIWGHNGVVTDACWSPDGRFIGSLN